MICDKKSVPELKSACKTCSEREECFAGCAVGVGCLYPSGAECAVSASQPLLIPHDYRNIKVGENTTITIDLEEMKEQLKKDFYRQSGLMFGA